jgi:hypothetical protein
MARYTVTLVFEAGLGKGPQGPDVLESMPLPERAVHRYSYCDGRTLTAVVDFRSAQPASVCRDVVEAVQRVWSQVAGVAVGAPLSVRVRPLRPPQPVGDGRARPREYIWQPDCGGPDGSLVLVDAGSDPIVWGDGPDGPWGPGTQARSSIAPPT